MNKFQNEVISMINRMIVNALPAASLLSVLLNYLKVGVPTGRRVLISNVMSAANIINVTK